MSFPALPTRLDGAGLALETRGVAKTYPPDVVALDVGSPGTELEFAL